MPYHMKPSNGHKIIFGKSGKYRTKRNMIDMIYLATYPAVICPLGKKNRNCIVNGDIWRNVSEEILSLRDLHTGISAQIAFWNPLLTTGQGHLTLCLVFFLWVRPGFPRSRYLPAAVEAVQMGSSRIWCQAWLSELFPCPFLQSWKEILVWCFFSFSCVTMVSPFFRMAVLEVCHISLSPSIDNMTTLTCSTRKRMNEKDTACRVYFCLSLVWKNSFPHYIVWKCQWSSWIFAAPNGLIITSGVNYLCLCTM